MVRAARPRNLAFAEYCSFVVLSYHIVQQCTLEVRIIAAAFHAWCCCVSQAASAVSAVNDRVRQLLKVLGCLACWLLPHVLRGFVFVWTQAFRSGMEHIFSVLSAFFVSLEFVSWGRPL